MNLYHGSPRNFDQFSQEFSRSANDNFGGGLAYLTTSKDVAKVYAKAGLKRTLKDGASPIVYSVKTNFKKVFDVDDEFEGNELKKFLPKDLDKFARAAGLIKFSDSPYLVKSKLSNGTIKVSGDQIFKGLDKVLGGSAKARDQIIRLGYDSLRYNGNAGSSIAPDHDVYIAYKASSLKIISKSPLDESESLSFREFLLR